MGKVFHNKICDICNKEGKVIETWGKKYCKECYDKKPKKGNGHSGMISVDEITRDGLLSQSSLFGEGLTLELTLQNSNISF